MTAHLSKTSQAPKDFGFGDDESMLRDMARKMLDDRMPLDRLRGLVAETPEPVYDQGQQPDWDKILWQEIVDLGWTGLAVPESDGGSGISLVGIAGMIEEVGRHALPSPLIPTLGASLVLRAAASANAKTVLSQIAGGKTASLAITNQRGSWDPADVPLKARPHPDAAQEDGLILDGTAAFIQDALKADILITSAALDTGETVLVAVDPKASGITVTPDHIHDLTRDQAHIRFQDVTVSHETIISRDGVSVLQAAWPSLLALVSADLVGASEWLLQTTVHYANDRVQFGRPIGFFQAVKHPLVDAMVMIDRAKSLLYHACAEIDAASPNSEIAARMAKSAASDAAAYASDRAIQLHGGVGFTWEYGLHLYFKRNLHNQALWGDGVYQRRLLADAIIGPIGATSP